MFKEQALAILKQKKNVRLIQYANLSSSNMYDVKSAAFGVLEQEVDLDQIDKNSFRCVTNQEPSVSEKKDLFFAWKIVKHVKSNAIVLAKDNRLIGVGAGQMSRVDSVKIALSKAKEYKHQTKGAVMASDAFFPFPDSIEIASMDGITAVVQPGGSIKDTDCIRVANRLSISMLFTGSRHFKH